MGIPYYFYSLTQKYNNIITNNKPISLDTYCIDFNGIIHNVAQDFIRKYNDINNLNNDMIELEIIEGVWERIKFYIVSQKRRG